MSGDGPQGCVDRVHVSIVFEQLAPPTGTLSWDPVGDGDPFDRVHFAFSGWLGLLSALERVIDSGVDLV